MRKIYIIKGDELEYAIKNVAHNLECINMH